MQDPLTSSFRWGETFDTAPYNGLHVLLVWGLEVSGKIWAI